MDSNSEINSKRSRRTFLLVIIIILLVFNGFLLIKFLQQKKQTTTFHEELVSTNNLKEKLDKEVKDYKGLIEKYKGKINLKNDSLVKYQKEIENQESIILELTKEDKITKAKYDKAIDEINKLRFYTEKYQKQINELAEENKELTKQNVKLKNTIKLNKKSIDSLEDQTTHLSNKVSLGSRIFIDKFNITGLMMKEGGKKKETMKGNKMDGLKITFTIKDNIIADKGAYDVYIKIINPKGETLYLEGYGSGKFDFQGEQSLYTVKTSIEFRNEPGTEYSVSWSKESNFEKGNYKAELYTNGHLIGAQKFVVK